MVVSQMFHFRIWGIIGFVGVLLWGTMGRLKLTIIKRGLEVWQVKSVQSIRNKDLSRENTGSYALGLVILGK